MLLLAVFAAATIAQDFTLPPGQYKAVVSLELNEKGKVKGCTVTQSSGYDEADAKTCKGLAKTGVFDPVVDAAGKPMKGTVSQTIRWKVSEPQ